MLSQPSCEPYCTQWAIPGRETIHCPLTALWWCMAPLMCVLLPFPHGDPPRAAHPAATLCGHMHTTKPLQWPECASSNLLEGARALHDDPHTLSHTYQYILTCFPKSSQASGPSASYFGFCPETSRPIGRVHPVRQGS